MREPGDLDKEEVLGLVQDVIRNTITHAGLWFRAAEDEMDIDEALRLDSSVWKKSFPAQTKRLCQRLGREDKGGHPSLKNMGRDELLALWEELARNWLTNDGVWFRTVEKKYGMDLAKKLNDETWKRFTVIEAKRIMERFQLPANGGIAALEQALKFKLYVHMNEHKTVRVNENKLIHRLNDCRVQSVRGKAGLPEYSCKSVGMIEYSYFARAIDPRIETRCIACPPDPHSEEYWCAWEFEIK